MPDSSLTPPSFMSERDLLMLTYGNVENIKSSLKANKEEIITSMRDMKDEITERINGLEENKYSRMEAQERKTNTDNVHADHERRLRRIENWGSIAVGGLAVLQFIAPLILKYIFKF